MRKVQAGWIIAVVYDIHSIDNERVHTFTVRRGQLEF